MKPCTVRASIRIWDFNHFHCYEYPNEILAEEWCATLPLCLGVTGGFWRSGARG